MGQSRSPRRGRCRLPHAEQPARGGRSSPALGSARDSKTPFALHPWNLDQGVGPLHDAPHLHTCVQGLQCTSDFFSSSWVNTSSSVWWTRVIPCQCSFTRHRDSRSTKALGDGHERYPSCVGKLSLSLSFDWSGEGSIFQLSSLMPVTRHTPESHGTPWSHTAHTGITRHAPESHGTLQSPCVCSCCSKCHAGVLSRVRPGLRWRGAFHQDPPVLSGAQAGAFLGSDEGRQLVPFESLRVRVALPSAVPSGTRQCLSFPAFPRAEGTASWTAT